jgi:hypothetical protein
MALWDGLVTLTRPKRNNNNKIYEVWPLGVVEPPPCPIGVVQSPPDRLRGWLNHPNFCFFFLNKKIKAFKKYIYDMALM